MSGQGNNRGVGWVALAIGLLTLSLFILEVRDGVLQGSRNHGVTETINPTGYYISVTLEGLVALGLIAFGVYSIRSQNSKFTS